MNTQRRFLMTMVALAVALPALAGPGHGEFGGGFGMGFLRKLDLSSEQKSQVKAIRQAGKDQTKALREAAKQSREALKDAMAGTADDAAVNKLFADSQAKHEALVTFGFQQLMKVRAILTPEQRAKVRALIDERRSGHRSKGGNEGDDAE